MGRAEEAEEMLNRIIEKGRERSGVEVVSPDVQHAEFALGMP